ncbi:MAG: cell division protein FtsZ, partial [Paraglaciecola sp.]
ANGTDNRTSAVTMETTKSVASDERVDSGSDLEYLDIPAFLRKQAD